jgi:hypothetical protein
MSDMITRICQNQIADLRREAVGTTLCGFLTGIGVAVVLMLGIVIAVELTNPSSANRKCPCPCVGCKQ